LKAHESKDMPVVFVVQTEVPDDIRTITLSYTFFELKADEAKQ
jgi:cytochrome c oxidase assembly protein subunit 11